MALSARFSERASVQKARMSAMNKFMQDMSDAEAVYSKSIAKAVDRLQASLASLDPKPPPQASGKPTLANQQAQAAAAQQSLQPAPITLSTVLADVATAIKTLAEEHGKHGVVAYTEAVSRMTSLNNEYTASSKAAIETVTDSGKCLNNAQVGLEKAYEGVERAILAASSADGSSKSGPDPWLCELNRQIAADDLMMDLSKHKVKLEEASRNFSDCDNTGRSKFIRIVADALAKICQMSERVQGGLSRAKVALQSMDQMQDGASWQKFAAQIAGQETQSASNLWRKCSQNALESTHIERQSLISRPGGFMGLSWKPGFAVITSFGYVHIFDMTPKTNEGELPRLITTPHTTLVLSGCTASMGDDNPSSQQVKIVVHSRLFPATTYILKLPSEEEVIDWMVSLKHLVPQDSVWMQRRNTLERSKNEKYYLKNYKPRDDFKQRQDSLYKPEVPQDRSKCRNGHDLQRFLRDKPGANGCDICGRKGIKPPEQVYRCETCDYDVCMDCYRCPKAAAEDPSQAADAQAAADSVSRQPASAEAAPDVQASVPAPSRPLSMDFTEEEASGLDGAWVSNNGMEYVINGVTLTAEGQTLSLQTDGTVVEILFGDQTFAGELNDDGRVYWSDGQIWTRTAACEAQQELADPSEGAGGYNS